jgi:thrombospondin motif-containing protein 18
MALLLSGLDFYAVEKGKNNYVTMGIKLNCIKNYLGKINLLFFLQVCPLSLVFALTNSVIEEFGVTNQQGQPYPSTGFTSVYVMAHEIGHK